MPSTDLLAGRRALESLKEFQLLEDYRWWERGGFWALHCRLRHRKTSAGPVPQATEWFVYLPTTYPFGEISFRPSKNNSLTRTFPHQRFNGLGDENVPWREGQLCLTIPLALLEKVGFVGEPYDPDSRLYWNVRRALTWLELAHVGELHKAGDPFELPDYPIHLSDQLAFDESPESLRTWENLEEVSGYARLALPHGKTGVRVVKSFDNELDHELFAPNWGRWVADAPAETLLAAWIRLKDLPVLDPWHPPSSWGELRDCLQSQGIDLYRHLRELSERLRDDSPHYLLLGFPIRKRFGDDCPHRMHWLALRLPVLATENAVRNGFRGNEVGLWMTDRRKFAGDRPVNWIATRCWSGDELSGRGRMRKSLRERRILILGCGALGSAVAESLVRGGVTQMVMVDPEVLVAGNLARHTLTLDDLGEHKAVALAARLNRITPHAEIEGLVGSFPDLRPEHHRRPEGADLILDCTAASEMPHHLASYDWTRELIFVRFSIGIHARRLYCFAAQARSFPSPEFINQMNPYLEEDLERNKHMDLPREGVGCWNPVLPARHDSVFMLAGVATQFLEDQLGGGRIETKLTIFEREDTDVGFAGIRRHTASN